MAAKKRLDGVRTEEGRDEAPEPTTSPGKYRCFHTIVFDVDEWTAEVETVEVKAVPAEGKPLRTES